MTKEFFGPVFKHLFIELARQVGSKSPGGAQDRGDARGRGLGEFTGGQGGSDLFLGYPFDVHDYFC